MGQIHVLDQITIDKIAAGEVIERPASIVKELVENSIDAGATAIVVEIKEGGIAFIRITDNGCGIAKEDLRAAFLRHSTSKITSADDLEDIHSLGFRGEALSSISAVTQVEVLTKTKDEILGSRYRIEGGKEISLEDAAAPDGTNFLIHQLFYNTPARRKFLKTPMTEASHISDLVARLALSHPEISFQFINNGQSKIHTSGNGDLKSVIYHLYGREIAGNLIEVDESFRGMHMKGFLGKPIISRGNRNFENYFINGRYIKSQVIYKAIEDGYKDFVMQHKYPFVVLHFTMDGQNTDVNVHPAKMEVRFSNQQEVYRFVCNAVEEGLHEKELIPKVEAPDAKEIPMPDKETEKGMDSASVLVQTESSGKEIGGQSSQNSEKERDLDYFMEKMKKRVRAYHEQQSKAEVSDRAEIEKHTGAMDKVREAVQYRIQNEEQPKLQRPVEESLQTEKKEQPVEKQLDFFEENLLKREVKAEYKIIGQAFDTYWLVEFHDNLYIIDQHAAHERVLYEKTLKGMKQREYTSQYISPPMVLNLSMQEAQLLEMYMEQFTRIGFEIEEFGESSYAVRAIPDNLFGIAKRELFIEMLDALSDEIRPNTAPDMIDEKIASMSCKAAVKGNSRLSFQEVDTLIGELLTLENPYHCPHGRPTIISMSRRDLEKKFKRIV